jgi:hypothetical protein
LKRKQTQEKNEANKQKYTEVLNERWSKRDETEAGEVQSRKEKTRNRKDN